MSPSNPASRKPAADPAAIPALDGGVHAAPKEPTRGWDLVELVAVIARRVLLYGPPGTGKSTLAHRLAARLGAAFYTFPATPDTPMSEIRGAYMPTPEGTLAWQDGPAIRAWREGAVLLIDEINHAGGDVLTFLHTLCDDPQIARLTLPTGETVTPHADFRIVATMNGTVDELPEALLSRFAARFHVEDPHPKALARLPKILHALAKDTIARDEGVTLRSWLAFAELSTRIGFVNAGEAIFAGMDNGLLKRMRDAFKLADVEGDMTADKLFEAAVAKRAAK